MNQTKHLVNDSNYLSSSPDWANTTMSNINDNPFASYHNNGHSDWTPGNDEEREDSVSSMSSLSDSMVREDYTLDFFRPLQQGDAEARASALSGILGLLHDSLKSEKKDLVRTHLKTIVRYSFEVPFDDLSSAFGKLMRRIEETGISLPKAKAIPSTFIPKNYFVPVNTDSPLRQIFMDLFLQTGRVSHLNRVLLLHQSYFEKYYAGYAFIMRDIGPLPLYWRNYIAILAASRHDCKWLVNMQETEFILNGGDPNWLQGIDHIPKKLHNLLEIIQILSHQPWLITKDHIAPIVKGEDSWSIGELVHAMIIICTIKSLTGIIFGCGVTPETDFSGFSDDPVPEEEDYHKESNSPSKFKDDTNKIMELLKKWEINDAEENQQHFVEAGKSDMSVPHTVEHSSDVSRYIGNLKMKHVDFDVKARNYSIFRVQDYCWKEHGFELVRRFLPDAAILLEEEFDHIFNMTYNMFNQNSDIDTLPLRKAIWQYVQRLKGMFHDDYNYQEVNVFLNIVSKNYVKKISCQPEILTKSDFVNLGYELKPDEKVHVAMLAIESAKQSELLYGLHAVFRHMYKS